MRITESEESEVPMRSCLIISAHLDDGCLSAGQFIGGRPDCVVATVFAGTPPTEALLTSYDDKCGFKSAGEAMEARRAEDLEAMSVLQAKARHLDFVDLQYGGKLKAASLVKQLCELIEDLDPEFVAGPLGLVHSDHEAVRDCVLDATMEATRPVWLYEDLPYRVQHPEAVPMAFDALRGRGYELELGFVGTGPIDKKMDALWSYRSQMQLPEFANRHELLVGERFWHMSKAVTPEEQA
jgi:LmbE family N-acetylglucosaminyl deacetylase